MKDWPLAAEKLPNSVPRSAALPGFRLPATSSWEKCPDPLPGVVPPRTTSNFVCAFQVTVPAPGMMLRIPGCSKPVPAWKSPGPTMLAAVEVTSPTVPVPKSEPPARMSGPNANAQQQPHAGLTV